MTNLTKQNNYLYPRSERVTSYFDKSQFVVQVNAIIPTHSYGTVLRNKSNIGQYQRENHPRVFLSFWMAVDTITSLLLTGKYIMFDSSYWLYGLVWSLIGYQS